MQYLCHSSACVVPPACHDRPSLQDHLYLCAQAALTATMCRLPKSARGSSEADFKTILDNLLCGAPLPDFHLQCQPFQSQQLCLPVPSEVLCQTSVPHAVHRSLAIQVCPASSDATQHLHSLPCDPQSFNIGNSAHGADMLIVHRLPEWPAAGTALVRLAVTLSSKAGIGHDSREVRAVCLDLWGTLAAQLFFEARTTREEEPVLAVLLGALRPQRQRDPGACLHQAPGHWLLAWLPWSERLMNTSWHPCTAEGGRSYLI